MYQFSGIFKDFSFLVGFDGRAIGVAVEMNLPTPPSLEDGSDDDDAIVLKPTVKRRRVRRKRPIDNTD